MMWLILLSLETRVGNMGPASSMKNLRLKGVQSLFPTGDSKGYVMK